jgi:hypothetical protein
MDALSPELLKIFLIGTMSVASLLLAINGFFIRSLVVSINESARKADAALAEITAMKKSVEDIPNLKIDVAVIKNTLEHKNELHSIFRKLGET